MAHIPDGFLSPPVIAGAAVVSVGALAVAARKSRAALGEREAPLLGAATAFVFAAQMVNVPIGAGTSAHLLGATLVAALLGPWSGALVMCAVVLVQALLFQDGGLLALGANTLNIAVLGTGVGWLVLRGTVDLAGAGPRRLLLAGAVAAFMSTTAVGVAVSAELALSGIVPLRAALALVGGIHLVVGAGEAVLTAMMLAALGASRPELLARTATPGPVSRRVATAGLAAALALALGAGYLTSARPDALHGALSRLGLGGRAVDAAGPFAGYTAPIGGPWVAGVLGVLVMFALGWGVASLARRRS